MDRMHYRISKKTALSDFLLWDTSLLKKTLVSVKLRQIRFGFFYGELSHDEKS